MLAVRWGSLSTPDSDRQAVWRSLWATCSGVMLLSNTSQESSPYVSITMDSICFSDITVALWVEEVVSWRGGGHCHYFTFHNTHWQHESLVILHHFLHHKPVMPVSFTVSANSIQNKKGRGQSSSTLGLRPHTESLDKQRELFSNKNHALENHVKYKWSSNGQHLLGVKVLGCKIGSELRKGLETLYC